MKNSNKTKPKRNLNLYSLLGVFLIFLLLFSCIIIGSKKNSSGNGGSNTGEDGEDVANGGDGSGGDGSEDVANGGDGSGGDGKGGDGSGGDGTKTTTKYTLTVSSPTCGTVTNGDSTINCGIGGSDCSAQFDKDKSVTLTATADANYTIGVWGGDCSGSSDCMLSIDANKTVTKAFTASTTDTDSDCVPDTTDVDDDNDGLIEIENLDMFNNIRHNLAGTSYKISSTALDNRMGAPTQATDDCDTASGGVYLCGYEFTKDLDFAQGASYASSSVNTNWRPNQSNPNMATNAGFAGADNFAALFEGNGFTISHLYSRGNSNRGLFRSITSTASIRNLGVVDANLYGSSGANQYIGALVGYNRGSISAGSATGGTVNNGSNSSSNANYAGGLVGLSNGGNITASYATGAVNGSDVEDNVGGLVGLILRGSNITASYATGAANGNAGADNVGGLVGYMFDGTNTITASYATGDVNGGAGDDSVGGLVSFLNDGTNTIIASYATGAANGDAGSDNVGALAGTIDFGTNSITASYATGAANGDTGTDNVGALVGKVSASGTNTITHSYGFGSGTKDGVGNDGTAHPGGLMGMGAAKANGLTDPAGVETTDADDVWDDASEKTKGAWNFGTGSQPPALKYADYDGSGGTDFSCDMFPAKIPGTNTALTCGTTLLPEQR